MSNCIQPLHLQAVARSEYLWTTDNHLRGLLLEISGTLLLEWLRCVPEIIEPVGRLDLASTPFLIKRDKLKLAPFFALIV